jgi:uncharacterized protein (TIGR03067 family)
MPFIGYIVTVGLLASAALGHTHQSSTIPKELKGVWVIGYRAYEPSPATNEAANLLNQLGAKVEFKGGKLEAADKNRAGNYLLVEFGSAGKLKSIDLKAPGKGKQVLRGIYRLENGLLTIAVGVGGARPQSFEKKADRILLLMKRLPKK